MWEMLYVNHHTICRTNQKHWYLRWLANGVFQNNDLCWQAFPFPPPPSPLLHFLFHSFFPPPPSLHFSLVPISWAAKLSKSRFSVFLCPEIPQKRLLRRLSFLWPKLDPVFWGFPAFSIMWLGSLRVWAPLFCLWFVIQEIRHSAWRLTKVSISVLLVSVLVFILSHYFLFCSFKVSEVFDFHVTCHGRRGFTLVCCHWSLPRNVLQHYFCVHVFTGSIAVGQCHTKSFKKLHLGSNIVYFR